eukprot:COSAG02_NODE_49256_length_328_cov_0.650655_2_plen_79_part_01
MWVRPVRRRGEHERIINVFITRHDRAGMRQVRAHATRDHTRISIDRIRMELLRRPRAELSRPSFAASRSISFNHTWCQH